MDVRVVLNWVRRASVREKSASFANAAGISCGVIATGGDDGGLGGEGEAGGGGEGDGGVGGGGMGDGGGGDGDGGNGGGVVSGGGGDGATICRSTGATPCNTPLSVAVAIATQLPE